MLKYSSEFLLKTIEDLPLPERRGWIIRLLMKRRGLTLETMAKRRRTTKAYLSGAISGLFPWRRRIVEALEAELKIELTELLTEEEAQKLGAEVVEE